MKIEFEKIIIPILFAVVFFVLWAIFGERFLGIVSLLALLFIIVCLGFMPSSDRRFKTGFKDNAVADIGPTMYGFIFFLNVYGIGVLVYDWEILQLLLCPLLRLVTLGMIDCT